MVRGTRIANRGLRSRLSIPEVTVDYDISQSETSTDPTLVGVRTHPFAFGLAVGVLTVIAVVITAAKVAGAIVDHVARSHATPVGLRHR